MRYTPVTIPGSSDSRLVENLDVAPTALKAAGLTTNRTPAIDGLSLFDPANSRSRLLFEFSNHQAFPLTDPFRNWASTRTTTYQYIESYAEDGVTIVFREYYDLVNDSGPALQPVRAGWPARRRGRPRHAGASGGAARRAAPA